MKGWHNESVRHSLSSKGIETAFGRSKVAEIHKKLEKNDSSHSPPPKELYLEDEDFEWIPEYAKMMKLFWWCHLHDTWEWYPFDRVIETLREGFDAELSDNISCLLSSNERHGVEEIVEEIKKNPTLEKINGYEWNPDVGESIKRDLVNKFRVYDKLRTKKRRNLQEKIQLMDELIDFFHAGGAFRSDGIMVSIQKDFMEKHLDDIPGLREEFKEEFVEDWVKERGLIEDE